MPQENGKKKQSLMEMFNLKRPRKRKPLSDEEKAVIESKSATLQHALKMSELCMKTETRRFG